MYSFAPIACQELCHFLSNNQKTSYISSDRGVVMLDPSNVSTNETSIVGLVYKCN